MYSYKKKHVFITIHHVFPCISLDPIQKETLCRSKPLGQAAGCSDEEVEQALFLNPVDLGESLVIGGVFDDIQPSNIGIFLRDFMGLIHHEVSQD